MCSQNYVSTHRVSLLLEYKWSSACLLGLSRSSSEILRLCVFLARPPHPHLVITIKAIFTLPFSYVCVSLQIPGLLVLPHLPYSNTHMSLHIPFFDPISHCSSPSETASMCCLELTIQQQQNCLHPQLLWVFSFSFPHWKLTLPWG